MKPLRGSRAEPLPPEARPKPEHVPEKAIQGEAPTPRAFHESTGFVETAHAAPRKRPKHSLQSASRARTRKEWTTPSRGRVSKGVKPLRGSRAEPLPPEARPNPEHSPEKDLQGKAPTPRAFHESTGFVETAHAAPGKQPKRKPSSLHTGTTRKRGGRAAPTGIRRRSRASFAYPERTCGGFLLHCTMDATVCHHMKRPAGGSAGRNITFEYSLLCICAT